MPHQARLVDALERHRLDVVEHRGWETRGSSWFSPRGVVCHHTGPGSVDGLIRLCINGRRDLSGPLANVVLAPDGACHLIAAGRAHHAGRGGWRGLSGNSTVFGIEAIHPGDPQVAWPDIQVDAYHRCAAALLDLAGADADMCCGHKEWAPGRKPDPTTLDMGEFRARVADLLAPPAPPREEGVIVANRPPVAVLAHPKGYGYWIVTDDGGVFAFQRDGAPGEIRFHGSLGGTPLVAPIVGADAAPDGEGYYLLGGDGAIFAFGSARYAGRVEFSRPG